MSDQAGTGSPESTVEMLRALVAAERRKVDVANTQFIRLREQYEEQASALYRLQLSKEQVLAASTDLLAAALEVDEATAVRMLETCVQFRREGMPPELAAGAALALEREL